MVYECKIDGIRSCPEQTPEDENQQITCYVECKITNYKKTQYQIESERKT